MGVRNSLPNTAIFRANSRRSIDKGETLKLTLVSRKLCGFGVEQPTVDSVSICFKTAFDDFLNFWIME